MTTLFVWQLSLGLYLISKGNIIAHDESRRRKPESHPTRFLKHEADHYTKWNKPDPEPDPYALWEPRLPSRRIGRMKL